MSGLIPRIMSGLCPTNPGDKYPQDHHEAEEQGDGCDWDLPMQDLRWGHPDFEQFPEFPDPRLKQGRAIWLGTCEACHAHEVAGAPLVTRKAAWAPRLAKGRDALYRSALGGLTGPMGTQMPPRGGNDKLTDDQVKAAVDYMMALARQTK